MTVSLYAWETGKYVPPVESPNLKKALAEVNRKHNTNFKADFKPIDTISRRNVGDVTGTIHICDLLSDADVPVFKYIIEYYVKLSAADESDHGSEINYSKNLLPLVTKALKGKEDALIDRISTEREDWMEKAEAEHPGWRFRAYSKTHYTTILRACVLCPAGGGYNRKKIDKAIAYAETMA